MSYVDCSLPSDECKPVYETIAVKIINIFNSVGRTSDTYTHIVYNYNLSWLSWVDNFPVNIKVLSV